MEMTMDCHTKANQVRARQSKSVFLPAISKARSIPIVELSCSFQLIPWVLIVFVTHVLP